MAYERTNWATNDLITADQLNKVEAALEDLNVVDELENAVRELTVPETGTVTYESDWGAYSSEQTPTIRKVGNAVCFSGAFAFSGTAFTSDGTGVTVCTIPEGFRPPAMVGVLCQGSGTNLWMLRVNSNGNVNVSRYRNAAGTYQQVISSSWFPFSASWIVS